MTWSLQHNAPITMRSLRAAALVPSHQPQYAEPLGRSVFFARFGVVYHLREALQLVGIGFLKLIEKLRVDWLAEAGQQAVDNLAYCRAGKLLAVEQRTVCVLVEVARLRALQHMLLN